MQENQAGPRDSRRQFLKTLLWGGAGIGAAATLGGPLALRARRELPKLYSQRHSLMGTWVSISVFSTREEHAFAAMERAFGEIRKVDELMSIHRPDSQISALNRAAGNERVRLAPEVLEVLASAQAHARLSQGRYDVTILPVMRLFGFYGTPPATIPKDPEIARTIESVGWKNLELDPIAGTAGLRKKGAAVDLGSIAKGYAVERAIESLRRDGISSALVDAGGNLHALGAPYGDPDPRAGWTIGIRDPRGEKLAPLKTLLLRDQSVATSGLDQTKVRIGSQEIGHIFDAVTGKPTREWLSCTAVAPSGMRSDALSTAGYVLGRDEAQRALGGEGVQFHFFG